MNDNVLIYDQDYLSIQQQDLSRGSIIVCYNDKRDVENATIPSWVVLKHYTMNSPEEIGFFYEKNHAVMFAEILD